jgi:thiol-disulfide isomerase/thioredoxin
MSQNSVVIDTSLNGAHALGGVKNPGVSFRKFSGTALDGKYLNNDSLKNKIVFINFWMESCAPCVAEFEFLNNLYSKYKNDDRFRFITFTNETTENARIVAHKYRLNYPIIPLPIDSLLYINYRHGFPTSIILNKEGSVYFIKCGGVSDKENAKKEVDAYFDSNIKTLLDNFQ